MFPGLKERFFLWERTLPGRKDSFIHGNATDESESGQDNGLIRYTGARCKIERGPQIFTGDRGFFTVPAALKLHFNPSGDELNWFVAGLLKGFWKTWDFILQKAKNLKSLNFSFFSLFSLTM